jgi:uncharacterized protein YndB with AHSA1/START domain
VTTTDLGTLVSDTVRPTIRFERRLRAPLERVWRAVTDEEEMRAWFPARVVGERKVGAPLRFPFEGGEADTFDGEVTVWEPMRAFAFTWNGDELRLELEEDGDATRLVFTQSIPHRTEAARTSSGWHFCLANLDAHLGGTAPAGDEWKPLYFQYLERMGPPLPRVTEQVAWTWERVHHVSPARLWECLTDPKELEAWMGSPATVDLREGGSIVHHFSEGDEVRCVIAACDAPRHLLYTFGDHTTVEWRIEPADFGVRYWFTQHALDREIAYGRGAGWHTFLMQLDMYAASGQLVEVEHESYFDAFKALLD